jgi:flagellar biogenesis protein FliO
MANPTKRSVTALALLLTVSVLSVTVLSLTANGQQSTLNNGEESTSEPFAESSAASATAFQSPPSFEKRPQRVPARAAAPVAFSNNTEEEWLPANQRNTAATNAAAMPSNELRIGQPTRNSPVQQASFTTPNIRGNSDNPNIGQSSTSNVRPEPIYAQTTQQVSNSAIEANANQSGKSRSGIPLKPPSKDVHDLAPSRSSSSWTSILSMVFSLILVIGIFLGLSWIFRKTSPTAGSMLPKEVVEIIGRTPMANRQQLYVIRFGRKLVLVSQQVGQTEVLSEIDDQTEVDHLLGLCEQNNSRNISTSFRNVLQQVATSTESKWSLRQRRSTPRTSSLDTLS